MKDPDSPDISSVLAATKLGTDASLPQPQDEVSEDEAAFFKKYQIIEASLFLSQKRKLAKMIVNNESGFAVDEFDLGC